MRLMKCAITRGVLIALPAVWFLAGCGGKQSTASKSAAAYAEAQKKGIPVGAGEHGGHAAEQATTTAEHAGMEEMDHRAMAGMEHGNMPAGEHEAMAGMQHAGMQPGEMQGMQHESMAGMQHGEMRGMHHVASANVAVVTEAPRSNSAMANVQPGATLQSDELDAAAPIAQREAAKATSGAMTHKKEE